MTRRNNHQNQTTMSETLLGEWYQHDLHTTMQNILFDQQHYQLFQMLKPELKQDGNQWCVLYGDNLQVGIAGFGDTPYEAIRNWNQAWHSKITKTNNSTYEQYT